MKGHSIFVFTFVSTCRTYAVLFLLQDIHCTYAVKIYMEMCKSGLYNVQCIVLSTVFI